LQNTVLPAVAPALSTVKKSIQDAAANVVEDVIQGENLKEAVKRNVTSEGKKLLAKVPSAFSGLMSKEDQLNEKSISQSPRLKQAAPRKRKQPQPKSQHSKIRRTQNFKKFPGLALIA